MEKVRRHHSLSSRERQLIELAAHGHTDAEIANELGIALGTVSTYWGRIRSKFGGSSRTELVACVLEETYETTIRELRGRATQLAAQMRARESGAEPDLFRQILDAAAEAVLIVDADCRIQYANVSALDLFGYEDGELVGSPLWRLVPDRYRTAHQLHVKDYFDHPMKHVMGEHRITPGRHKSGIEIPIMASLSHNMTEDGPLVTCFIHAVPKTLSL